MAARPVSLWRHRAFLALWAGQGISALGTQVTALALPLTALQLGAGPAQMGLLLTVQTAPFLVLSLVAGAWVDRMRRWPVLIWADLGRGALLFTIPIAAAFDRLVLAQLYAVGLVSGLLTLLFGIAYAAYLPRVVGRAALLEANSRIATTDQIARVSGAGLGGAAVQLLTAPVAIAADALSFLIAAFFLRLGRVEEPASEGPPQRRGFRGEIAGGPSFVWRTPAVRAIVVATGLSNLAGGALNALLILFLRDELGLSPALIGVIYGTAAAAGVFASLLPARIAARLGSGRTMIGVLALFGAATMAAPLAAALPGLSLPILLSGRALASAAGLIYSVVGFSLLQSLTPEPMLGRMAATTQTLATGALALGALGGGFLAEQIGLTPTLWCAAAGTSLGLPLLWWSPVRRMAQPSPPDDLEAVR